MADRRMFSKTIIDSDTFLDMPLSAQALYFHLSMRADDDGFINNPKKIQRMIGSSGDFSKIGSSGKSARIGANGDFSKIMSNSKYSVICCAGNNSIAKEKKGSWITLS